MIIKKDTGDIVFGEDLILKAEMPIDDIKNSKLVNFLTEESLNEEFHLLFKPFSVEEELVYISAYLIDRELSIINIFLEIGEPNSIFEISDQEFQQVVVRYREFLKKILQVDFIDSEIDFSWGRVELEVNYRERQIEIAINYI